MIDMDGLSWSELLDPSDRIRLRKIEDVRMRNVMQTFQIGARVGFCTRKAEWIEGVVNRHDRRTSTVISDRGFRFLVSPNFVLPRLTRNATATDAAQPEMLLLERALTCPMRGAGRSARVSA